MSRFQKNITHFSAGVFFLLCLLYIPTVNAQQRVQFTQYMFNGLVLNPAYAGAHQALHATLIHRSQWAGVDGAPKSQTLSAHSLFKKKNIGLGFILSNDMIGVHRNLNFMTTYAYHLNLGRERYLSFGLQAGIQNRKSDYTSLLAEAGDDPKVIYGDFSQHFFDFGTGIYFRSEKLHVGYSIPELLPEKIYLNDSLIINMNSLNHFLFSRYSAGINENFDLEPSFLLKYIAGSPISYDINMNVIYRDVLTMGLSYRKKESVDMLVKFQFTPQLQAGYSYDYPIGEISSFTNSSHELMISYLFSFKESNVVSPR